MGMLEGIITARVPADAGPPVAGRRWYFNSKSKTWFSLRAVGPAGREVGPVEDPAVGG